VQIPFINRCEKFSRSENCVQSFGNIKMGFTKAQRRNVWDTHNGKRYEAKCKVDGCKTIVTVWDFEIGHDKPRSKGGSDTVENLYPICGVCNKSMGARYTIKEFGKIMKGEESGCCVIA
jgi:5-methylcytosine-specific restriction endonuclease McrA